MKEWKIKNIVNLLQQFMALLKLFNKAFAHGGYENCIRHDSNVKRGWR